MNEPTQPRRLWRPLLVMVVLFILPLGSIWFLLQGVDYQRTARSEMENLGTAPDLTNLPVIYGPAYRTDKAQVINLISGAYSASRDTYGLMLRRLYDQFDTTSHLQFTALARADLDTAALLGFVEQHYLAYPNRMRIMMADAPTFDRIAAELGLATDSYGLPGERSIATLVDTTSTIRGHYDLAQLSEVQRLIRHLVIISPPRVERDAILQRETEK